MAGTLGQMAGVAMGVIGFVSVLRARRARREVGSGPDTQLAERMDMERRMASYLAARDDMRTGARDDRS